LPFRAGSGIRSTVRIFLADDQRNDTLGCAGHGIVKTPNVGQLARQGVRFVNKVLADMRASLRACHPVAARNLVRSRKKNREAPRAKRLAAVWKTSGNAANGAAGRQAKVGRAVH
jgi:hypothetical protein